MESTIALAQPFEAQFKYHNADGSVGWADCQVVAVKDAGLSQTLIVLTVGTHGMLGAIEVSEVRPVMHQN